MPRRPLPTVMCSREAKRRWSARRWKRRSERNLTAKKRKRREKGGEGNLTAKNVERKAPTQSFTGEVLCAGKFFFMKVIRRFLRSSVEGPRSRVRAGCGCVIPDRRPF